MAIASIWANRLIAGTKTWADVPPVRREPVKEELRRRVEAGEITAERYEEITGEACEAKP
jgi:hypothetical protein